MSLNFLDFEQPIAELEAKIDSLTAVSRQDEKLDINIDEEVHRLREKSVELTRKIFADLGAWQIAQLARHTSAISFLDSCSPVSGLTRLSAVAVTIFSHSCPLESADA